ncbi:hypothetical protein RclHR1_07070001 [Rhizophagus clarus]|uniref:Uncharacterized protein n=1 Tax=Rhizophagus clarus TaxID=94130 RepID=A0A2Z6SKH2_9GLOM|nr:hypothetical protein RclHR1_07070001 [Rhizophagus clarus]
MIFKSFYVKIEIENEGNLNELLLNFIGTQNNRAFFKPISPIPNSFQNISSLLIKSIVLFSFSPSSSSSTFSSSIALDTSQLLYPTLKNDMEQDYRIFDKNLKWNLIFEIIKKENLLFFSPLRFDIELYYLYNCLKMFEEYEDKWSYYSYEDTMVAQCSLGSIFRFYSLSKKIFRHGIFNKKFQSKIHINSDEKKK